MERRCGKDCWNFWDCWLSVVSVGDFANPATLQPKVHDGLNSRCIILDLSTWDDLAQKVQGFRIGLKGFAVHFESLVK